MDTLRKFGIPLLLVIAIGSSTASIYFYRQVNALKQDPNKVSKEEVAKLVATVGQLILLPDGEDPTIATVADPEKLKDQQFFEHASKGDKVLIYTNARKAVLYDPIVNKIINVAPVNIGNESGKKTKTATSESEKTKTR